ncbi:uncharacterized protein LOC133898581 [Phragmites australis]|uniref:uncharacterized protein LOC133898581 n=1 Tax=Phragmites australis TaxID=29695 RepID=UPI002D7896E3|nr:uncharacterized protein LOC133898581 [Phragmites australis]
MEGIGAATAPPQAPPPTRRAAAAATLRGLLALAADAVVYCFLVGLWLCNVTSAAFIAARRACGEDSPAAAIAKQLFVVALVATGLLFYFAAPLLLWRSGNGGRKTEAREEIGGGGDAKRPVAQGRRSENTGTRGRQDGVGPITAHVLIFLIMVMVLGMLMQVLAPEKESCEGRVGSMLVDVGSFLYSLMFCFIVSPNFLIQPRASRAKVKC